MSANFNELVETLYDNIVAAHNSGSYFNGVRTFKKGIFYNTAAFPVIAVMPTKDFISSYFSSNTYNTKRIISIEVYAKSAKKINAKQQSSDLIVELREYIKNNIDLGGITFDITIPRESYYEEFLTSEWVVGQNLNLEIVSQEVIPDPVTLEESITLDGDFLVDEVTDLFVTYAGSSFNSLDRSLKEIKGIYKDYSIENISVPALVIQDVSSGRDRKYRGADVRTVLIEVNIYIKLLDRTSAIHQMLRIIEKIKQIILINLISQKKFSEKHDVLQTVYNSSTIDTGLYGNFPVYQGKVSFEVKTRELNPV